MRTNNAKEQLRRDLGESVLGRRNSRFQDPEADVCLMYRRKRKQASEAGGATARGRLVGDRAGQIEHDIIVYWVLVR